MDEEIKKILEENLALTKEIHQMISKVRRYLLWQRIVGLIYLVLIIGPLMLAFIYLPPIIGPMLQQYQELLGGLSQQQSNLTAPGGGISPKDLQKWQGLLENLQKASGFQAPQR